MTKLFSINVDQSFHVRMAEVSKRLDSGMREAIQKITANLAEATYAKAIELANQRLHSTAEQYIDSLKFETVSPGVYSVSLSKDAEHLEEGYSRYDMKPGLLKNAKKRSKAGYRYRSIPFKHGKGEKGSSGDMLADLQRLRRGFDDNGITKDESGQPLLGKIFSINRNDVGVWALNPSQGGVQPMTQRFAEPDPSRNLVGLTKFQYSQQLRGGGSRVRSAYVTWRTVSERPDLANKWIHPGFGGVHIFNDLYRWVEEQVDRALRDLVGP